MHSCRYFIEVSYDGTAFHGSQIQGSLLTVQFTLDKAISTILRKSTETYGASRTDEGVHALCNIYHFDTDYPLSEKFVYQLNAVLPPSLSIVQLYKVHTEANARFDAISRTYRYKLYFQKNPFLDKRALYYPYPFNENILHETAALLKNYTDFETFSKKNTQSYTNNCTIFESYWESKNDELHYVVSANRFLRGMVRALVGTQLKIAKKQLALSDFQSIIESKDCNQADFSVTGNGLYLEKINYPDNYLHIVPQFKFNKR